MLNKQIEQQLSELTSTTKTDTTKLKPIHNLTTTHLEGELIMIAKNYRDIGWTFRGDDIQKINLYIIDNSLHYLGSTINNICKDIVIQYDLNLTEELFNPAVMNIIVGNNISFVEGTASNLVVLSCYEVKRMASKLPAYML